MFLVGVTPIDRNMILPGLPTTPRQIMGSAKINCSFVAEGTVRLAYIYIYISRNNSHDMEKLKLRDVLPITGHEGPEGG